MVGIMAGIVTFLFLHWQFCFYYFLLAKLLPVIYQKRSLEIVNEANKQEKIVSR